MIAKRCAAICSGRIIALLLTGLLFLFSLTVIHAQTSGGNWRVLVAVEDTEARAKERMAASLAGIEDVEVLPYQGKWGIFVGSHSTEQLAKAASQQLTDSVGLLSQGIVFFPTGAGSSSTGAVSAATAGGGPYRVAVGSYPDQASAQARKSELERMGIFPVDLDQRGAEHVVLAGYDFPTQEQAQRYADELKSLNVSIKGIVSSKPSSLEFQETPRPDAARLGAENRTRLDDALNTGDVSRARLVFDEWQRVDPGNPDLPAYKVRVEAAEARAAKPDATPVVEESRYQQMKSEAEAAENAKSFDEAIRIWQEISKLPGVRPEQSLEARQAISRLNDERFRQPAPATGATSPSAGDGGMMKVILIVVVVVVVLAAAAGFVIMKKKKGESAPAPAKSKAATPAVTAAKTKGGNVAPAQKGSMASSGGMPVLSPPPSFGHHKTGAAAKTEVATPAASRTSPEAVEEDASSGSSVRLDMSPSAPHPVGPSPEDDFAEPSGISLEPGAPGSASETQVDMSGSKAAAPAGDVGFARISPTPLPPTQKAPPAARPAVAAGESSDRRPIPIIREASAGRAGTPAASETQIDMGNLTPPMESKKDTTEVDLGGSKSRRPALVATSDRLIFYQQNFENEETGKPPRNWEGSYPHASLTVAEVDGARCMRFEKTTGTGSAFYTCKFPDASGRVVVEYDIRCDHKNKYLLGFYIEKDADFRHSVHTVVHRDISDAEKITLRLQNESTAYQLGEWVHVRFLIDLPRSLVDGYVNNNPVALGVRLASRPKAVNTLSIRDNLATEGILMIRGIQIYQER